MGNSPLRSIKAVSDHLTERIKLDLTDDPTKPLHIVAEPIVSDHSSESVGSSSSGIVRHNFGRTAQAQARIRPDGPVPYGIEDPQPTSASMNNNLMFRSMFFMNDEARHFLAPALPLPPTESDYFQKKVEYFYNLKKNLNSFIYMFRF